MLNFFKIHTIEKCIYYPKITQRIRTIYYTQLLLLLRLLLCAVAEQQLL